MALSLVWFSQTVRDPGRFVHASRSGTAWLAGNTNPGLFDPGNLKTRGGGGTWCLACRLTTASHEGGKGDLARPS